MGNLATIAIPTRSRLKYLQEAVASALAQTYEEVEVLVGQDPLPDGLDRAVEEWCRGAAIRDARVRYQANATRLGLAGNWNALAGAARGDFLLIMGDDDRLLPDALAKLLPPAQQSGARIVFSNHYIIDERGERLAAESAEATREYGRDRLPPGEVVDPEIWVWQGAVPVGSAIIRTDDVRRLRFKDDLNTPEIELFLRAAREGVPFFFLPEYLSEYRVHPGSATASGLWIDRLVLRLFEIPASQEVEPYKRQALAKLMTSAVSRALLQGDSETAKKLLASEYYPEAERSRLKGMIQAFCAGLPLPLGSWLYALAHRAGRSGFVAG
jgi:GT2 family glycosyltransferase